MRECKHCGELYRGLACPCRKRAAAEFRRREAERLSADVPAADSVSASVPAPVDDHDNGPQPGAGG